jgi:hypothetical protein
MDQSSIQNRTGDKIFLGMAYSTGNHWCALGSLYKLKEEVEENGK